MEVPSESFHRSSWDSRTCYARRAFNRGLTDDYSRPWGSRFPFGALPVGAFPILCSLDRPLIKGICKADQENKTQDRRQ